MTEISPYTIIDNGIRYLIYSTCGIFVKDFQDAASKTSPLVLNENKVSSFLLRQSGSFLYSFIPRVGPSSNYSYLISYNQCTQTSDSRIFKFSACCFNCLFGTLTTGGGVLPFSCSPMSPSSSSLPSSCSSSVALRFAESWFANYVTFELKVYISRSQVLSTAHSSTHCASISSSISRPCC